MSNHVFALAPQIKAPRSVFRRPFNLKTTIGVDYLYPIYVDEALPGDTFTFSGRIFGRLSTPIVPLMDDLYLDTFYFAVPLRLIDKNWKKIMGESTITDPNTETFAETNVSFMRVNAADNTPCSLHDYLGLPVGFRQDINPCFHRSYNLIFNEWFRSEDLMPYVKVGGMLPNGTQTTEVASDYVLLKRAKRPDYFTSCLPFPCKGTPPALSLGSSASVYGNGYPAQFKYVGTDSNTYVGTLRERYLSSSEQSAQDSAHTGIYSDMFIGGTGGGSDKLSTIGTDLYFATKTDYPAGSLYADLSTAQAVTVNQLREAFATQRFLETNARGGTRYIEMIRAHFGVVSPDARMQRPEYLGGSSQPLNVNTVPQTSATDSTSPQGNLAAFITGSNDASWTKTFTEHCVILGLANIRADISYQQGTPRMFSRRTRFDYYWPEFANLGEQVVYNREIYATGGENDGGVFGYQERWAEYRYHPNMITGMFRSTAPLSLDYWHLAEKFDSLPVLGETFIKSNVPIQRALAVNENVHAQFILDGHFDVKCARPMPLYSVPSLARL